MGKEVMKFAKRDMIERKAEEWEAADVASGKPADITVVGDGGWGKRSLGHSYDSNTGMHLELFFSGKCWRCDCFV